VIDGNIEVMSSVTSVSVAIVGVEASDWMSVLTAMSEVSVGCARGSVVMEGSPSSTELLTEGWTESVENVGVENSVWIAVSGASVSNKEVGRLWLSEVRSVVGPPRISESDVSMLEGSLIAVAVANTGTLSEMTTLL
jgi:hypothetical protein